MQNQYSAVIKQKGKFWIGWVKEIPGVNCQEHTREELINTLKITLTEAIEFNSKEALFAVGDNYFEESFVI